MPNHLKAYVVIVAIGFMCHLLWQRAAPGLAVIAPEGPTVRRVSKLYFTAWAVLTSVVFLSSNYYLFIFSAAVVVFMVRKNVPYQAQGGLYVVLLLAAPSLSKSLPGFFGLNRLFEMSWPIILGLVFAFTGQSRKTFVLSSRMDWIVLAMFGVVALLSFRATSFTDGLRETFLYFNLICIPYFIARKWCVDIVSVKFSMLGAVLIIFIMSGIAIFVSLRHWNLYQTLIGSLGLPIPTITNYKYREGFLRTSATLGSIHLAAVGFCGVIMYFFLSAKKKKSPPQLLILAAFFMAIVLTFSRAPWLVGAGMLALYMAMAYRSKGLFYLLAGVMALGVVLMATGMLDAVMDSFLLKNSTNVDYRQRLLELGAAEIMRNPLFGNTHFMNSPRLQELRQGEGIIDIVNTYLQVGLQFGLIALALFVCMVFVWPITQYRRIKRMRDEQLLGAAQVYLVVMLGLAAVIFTVSSFGSGSVFFPLLMFLVGMGHGLRRR